MHTPHCYGKMFWVLNVDFKVDVPFNLCACNYGRFACLELTRNKAIVLKAEIENLKVNGVLDVYNPKLKELFYKGEIFYKTCCTCKKEFPTLNFKEYSNECSSCESCEGCEGCEKFENNK